MRLSLAFHTLALVGMLFLPTFQVRADDEAVLAEDRLPSNVLLYVSSPDVVSTFEKFQGTGIGRMFQDPGLEKFRKQLEDLYGEFKEEAESKSGLKIDDVVGIFEGEVAFAVVRPVGQTLGWVAFLEYGDQKATIDALLKRSQDELKKEGDEKVTVETEEIDGVTVTSYTYEDENAENGFPVTVSLLQKDGILVAGSGINILETVLERWDGEHEDTFSGNKIYEEIYAKCASGDDADPGLIWYVDPIGLLSAGLSMSPQTQNFVGMIYMPALGLKDLKAMGGVAEFNTKDFDSVGKSMIYLDGPPTGVIKVFQLRANPLEVPAWVPADAAQYISFDWDINGAYEAIESIYDSFLGAGRFSMATANLLQQAGLDLKLKPDVIDVLSGKFQGYFNAGAASPEDFQGLLSIGVKDGAKGQKLVSGLMDLAGGSKASDVSGAKLYEPAGEGQPGAIAVSSNAILLSTQTETVKNALSARPSNPLTSSPEFVSALKYVPKQVSFFTFQNPAVQLAEVYEKARSGELDGLAEGKLDFSVLPPFETLSKYITPTAGYYIPDEKGSISVQFTVKAAK